MLMAHYETMAKPMGNLPPIVALTSQKTSSNDCNSSSGLSESTSSKVLPLSQRHSCLQRLEVSPNQLLDKQAVYSRQNKSTDAERHFDGVPSSVSTLMVGNMSSSSFTGTVKIIPMFVGVDDKPILPLVDIVQSCYGNFVKVVEFEVMKVEGGVGLEFCSPKFLERDFLKVPCSQLV